MADLMKITLWQQFSSNHSGSFTVVGNFGTPEEAEKIATQLWDWLQQMLNKGITELGQQISETYKLDWYPDGVSWNGGPTNMDEAVIRIGNTVFLTTDSYETWNDATPFAGLMWKLGAREVLYATDETLYLGIQLTCLAPDEKTADEVYDQVNKYLRDKEPIHLPPWEDETESGLAWGYIHQKERKIKMSLQFWKAASGFRALMNYLHTKGFTEITYHFEQDRQWNERDLRSWASRSNDDVFRWD
jgi:hypothetical protein